MFLSERFSTNWSIKLPWYGRELVRVDPAYTSQQCHRCEHVESANRKGSRFACNRCGLSEDADVNAAKNILARAMAGGLWTRIGKSGSERLEIARRGAVLSKSEQFQGTQQQRKGNKHSDPELTGRKSCLFMVTLALFLLPAPVF